MEQRIQTGCLLILAAVASCGALHIMRSVLVPLVLAIFLSLALTSLADALIAKVKMKRILALGITSLVGLGGIIFVVAFVGASVSTLMENAEVYRERFLAMLEQGLASLPEGISSRLPDDSEALLATLPSDAVSGALLNTGNALVGILSNLAIIIIFTAFITLGSSGSQMRSKGTWAEIERRIKKYLAAKVGVSMIVGVICYFIYLTLGVELALVFGLFHFLLNFIPNVGSFIALVLPLPLVMMDPNMGPVARVLAFALPLVINVGVGNVLEPKVMGETLMIHPVTILLALMFWGVLWGIPGMFLAVPLTSALSLLLEKLPQTRWIAMLMAGDVSEFQEEMAEMRGDVEEEVATG